MAPPTSFDPIAMAPVGAAGRAPGPSALGALATQMAACRELWAPYVVHDPGHRVHVRLVGMPAWEAWLITWPPGHGVEVHDHGGSTGAIAVVEGELVEVTAARRLRGGPHLSRRTLAPGEVHRVGRRRIHDVLNVGSARATSLHLYGPALSSMTFYDDDLRPVRTEVTFPEAPLLDTATVVQGLARGARRVAAHR